MIRSQSFPAIVGREVVAVIIPIAVLVGVWQLAYLAMRRNTFLRSPSEAISFFVTGERTGELFAALGSTFAILIIGYVIALFVAVLLASVVTASDLLARAIYPLALFLGVIPVVVITPIVILLVGRSIATSITVCVMITFFTCFVSVVSGMRTVSGSITDLSHVLGAGPVRTAFNVRLPGAVPSLLSASKLAIPASLSGVILTEFIATGQGVGTFINLSRANYQYIDMWSGMLLVVVLSALTYALVGAAEIVVKRRFASRPGAL